MRLIRVSDDRLAQLRTVRAELNAPTDGAAIGALLRRFVAERGKVAVPLPGVDLRRFPDGICVAFDGDELTGFDVAEAHAFADALDAILDGRDATLRDGWSVRRRGSGFAVRIDATERLWDRDVMRDFLALVREALSGLPKAA